MQTPIQIVWYKRDLRIHDHLPLADASHHGPVLPLFAWEPGAIEGEDYARQHQVFAEECLVELESELAGLGLSLVRWPTGIIDALTTIRRHYPIAGLWSHEETGNDATYRIDKTVMTWCRVHGVNWHEYPQNGVVRRLGNRDRWNGHWEQRMQTPQIRLPREVVAVPPMLRPSTPQPIAAREDKPRRQRGGRARALDILGSFLEQRASRYRPCMSSPLTATQACSRLSPYLAWGVVSMKEVVQATRARQQSLQEPDVFAPRGLLTGLRAFESRLHWHCHFMQKLESEPELEFRNLHRAHDRLREMQPSDHDQRRRLAAWCNGETGWPLIDACMAMLRETGWVNFRMRAMLMSTASYLYWLHWRQPGLHLAREFLDYEPGIHWSQVQMQSGTTGINALRIYNPVKQARDQDPTGAFVRRWLPALQHVPDSWIFQPWLMPQVLQQRSGCVIDRDYPAPLVEVERATREARARLLAVRRDEEALAESSAIVKKHGSRKGVPGSVRDAHGGERQPRRKPNGTHPRQKELFE